MGNKIKTGLTYLAFGLGSSCISNNFEEQPPKIISQEIPKREYTISTNFQLGYAIFDFPMDGSADCVIFRKRDGKTTEYELGPNKNFDLWLTASRIILGDHPPEVQNHFYNQLDELSKR